jgi:hypothetical protein
MEETVTSFLPKFLRADAESAVELGRRILPGDDLREFDDRVLVEVLSEARKELVADVAAGDRHPVGVFESGAFSNVE